MKPSLTIDDYKGYHNNRPKGEIIKGNSYKDLSTICIIPTRGVIPAKVVQSWWSLMTPMNQKFTRIFVEGMEVGEAYSAAIENILNTPELANWKYILTLEEDNCPPPDGLLKLYESMDKYDVVGGLYWTKGVDGKPMCYDDQTEVLTKEGFKFFKDVKKIDYIATLTCDGKLEYHQPLDKQVFIYSGDLLHWKAQRFDLKVTPEHGLHCRKRGSDKFERVIASDMEAKTKFYWKKDAIWKGEEQEFFRISDRIVVSMDYWLEFLGYYLSEGHCPKKSKKLVDIRQCKKETYERIFNVINNLEFSPIKRDGRIQFNHPDIRKMLVEFGKSGDKYVPDYIFNLSPRQIKIFLDALWRGDGSWKGGKWENYYTKSKKLADNVQHLLLLVGIAGTIGRNRENYVISTVKNRLNPIVSNKAKRVKYEGIVYDLTVPNHTLYIRRNGRAIWSGNCYGNPDVYPVNFIPFMPNPDSVVRANGLGMGFNLWKMEMFKDKRLPKPLFKTVQSYKEGVGASAYTQDLKFFEEAGKLGYKFACDARIKVGHWQQDAATMW